MSKIKSFAIGFTTSVASFCAFGLLSGGAAPANAAGKESGLLLVMTIAFFALLGTAVKLRPGKGGNTSEAGRTLPASVKSGAPRGETTDRNMVLLGVLLGLGVLATLSAFGRAMAYPLHLG